MQFLSTNQHKNLAIYFKTDLAISFFLQKYFNARLHLTFIVQERYASTCIRRESLTNKITILSLTHNGLLPRQRIEASYSKFQIAKGFPCLSNHALKELPIRKRQAAIMAASAQLDEDTPRGEENNDVYRASISEMMDILKNVSATLDRKVHFGKKNFLNAS